MEFKLKTLAPCVNVKEIANVHFFVFPSDFQTGTDRHSFAEFVYVSSGVLDIRSESYTGPLKKGQAVFHAPNEGHALSCVKGNTPTVIIIGFTCNGLPNVLFGKKTELTDSETVLLASIIREGRSVFAPPYDIPTYNMQKKKEVPFGAEQNLKNSIELLIISIARRALEKNKTPQLSSSGFDIKEAVKYIDDNYKEKITIDELSFLFGTNRSSLCTDFKKQTGKSINSYIVAKKVVESKRLLIETDKSITEIAENLNFTSIHYFTAFFKKATGVSPLKYRENQVKENAAFLSAKNSD